MDVIEKLVGDEDKYENFIHNLLQAQEMNSLPACIKFRNPMDVTMKDIQEFSNMVKEDTGMFVYFQAFTCDTCGELHLQMIVFEDDDEEDSFFNDEPGTLLQ